jgi:hypothetical protein
MGIRDREWMPSPAAAGRVIQHRAKALLKYEEWTESPKIEGVLTIEPLPKMNSDVRARVIQYCLGGILSSPGEIAPRGAFPKESAPHSRYPDPSRAL